MKDHVKTFLINLLWILLGVAVGGALLLATFGSFGDFAIGLNQKLFSGSIIATQLGISFGLFQTSVFVDIVKILLLVAGVVLGMICLRWIISYVSGPTTTPPSP